ncbi:MAG: PRC-barrel domain-containing protein [Geitlerinemataceae cyanobacterium]
MSDIPATTVDRSELLDQLVLDRTTTETVGKVEQLWLDVNTHKVVGMTCKSGLLGRQKHSFTWRQVHAIGEDSLLVNAPETAQLEKLESWESLVGHQLWSDGGNRAGSIVDYRFEAKTGNVVEYLFTPVSGGELTDGIYRLSVSAVVGVGSKRMIAREAALQDAPQEETVATSVLDRAAEFLKEDYAKTREHLTGVQRGTKDITHRLKEKLPQPLPDTSPLRESESLDTTSGLPPSSSGDVPVDKAE